MSKIDIRHIARDKLDKSLAEYWIPWRKNPGMYDLHALAIERLR